MAYIKKLVMQGFKSFAKKTEVIMDPGINVILGPNGSGKSNVSDALCFVLGRLSAKSMRAAKSSNLIFLGTKSIQRAKEAVVEVIFDNQDKSFEYDKEEVSIKRIVRKNGQSIYKINNETKTRQDVLALLAQAGIDPNGFNIILQGEIQNFVKMHTEERRKVIEEVAGISIYEHRKEKSLKELEKTQEKLKEITSILKERTSYLNNLERERQQALKFKKLESSIKSYKKSIIYFDIEVKQKQIKEIEEKIQNTSNSINKIKKQIIEQKTKITNLESQISQINKKIQEKTGLEQEQLNTQIANFSAELVGLGVKSENIEKKLNSFMKEKSGLRELISTNQALINELNKESPNLAKKQKEIEKKKKEIEELEKERKKFYYTKSELKSIKERLNDKSVLFNSYQNQLDYLEKQIDKIIIELYDKSSSIEKLNELKSKIEQKNQNLELLNQRELELEKASHTNQFEKQNQGKIIDQVTQVGKVCPLCKSEITNDHINKIKSDINPRIEKLEEELEKIDKELNSIYQTRDLLKKDKEQLNLEINKMDSDLSKIREIQNKKEQIIELKEKQELLKKEIEELASKRKNLEKDFDENSDIESRYDLLSVELQEISLRTVENVNSEISFKQRELERAKISLNQITREEGDLEEELSHIKKEIELKQNEKNKKQEQNKVLVEKCNEFIKQRQAVQDKIKFEESELSSLNSQVYQNEQRFNDFKIEKARYDAELENLESEILDYPQIEIIKTRDKTKLIQTLRQMQETFSKIGSVNLRSLEVYDEVRKEYESIQEKVSTIENEQQGILKVIAQIDIRKKKAFMETFEKLNEIFSTNFAKISSKGQVSLEIENKKSPFEGGVSILVKMGAGKFFDVTSLSGGEQTMVALSLIFAIQELNPYCFYILDEVDAALDKRNASRLAEFLNQYMKRGQYIVITHNDEVISNATNLYGVSMHEGISKLVSLKV